MPHMEGFLRITHLKAHKVTGMFISPAVWTQSLSCKNCLHVVEGAPAIWLQSRFHHCKNRYYTTFFKSIVCKYEVIRIRLPDSNVFMDKFTKKKHIIF